METANKELQELKEKNQKLDDMLADERKQKEALLNELAKKNG